MHRGTSSGTSHVVRQINKALDLEVLVPVPRHPPIQDDLTKTSLGLAMESVAARRTAKCNKMEPLKTILARYLACNVDAIPFQVLKQFQWEHIKLIWERVTEELLDSLEVFAKFACAFSDDMKALKTLHCSVIDLPRVLGRLTSIASVYADGQNPGIGSKVHPWLVHLDLSHILVNPDILLQLGSVPGLTVLKVNESGITNETINHWARSQSVGRFSTLRLLDVRANSSGIKSLPGAVEKLLCFKKLELIRCDTFDSPWLTCTEDDRSQYLKMWSDITDQKVTTVQLRVHLGSHADRRPIIRPVDDVVVDVGRARSNLASSAVVIAPKHKPPDALSLRKQKKQKKLLADGSDIWRHGF